MSLLQNLPSAIYNDLVKRTDWVQHVAWATNTRNGSTIKAEDLIYSLHNRGYSCEKFLKLIKQFESSGGSSISNINKECTASVKIAILIANYKYEYWSDLISPPSDCRALGDILKSMGFLVIIIENVKTNNFKTIIQEISLIIPTKAYVFFYYAGHGFELCGTKYMLGTESFSEKYTIQNGVSENFIFQHGFTNKPELYILLLDMCRIQPDKLTNPEIFLNIPPAEEYLPTSNRIVGYSTSPYMKSLEKIDSESQLQHDTCDSIKISNRPTTCCENDSESDGIGINSTKELKSKHLSGISLYVKSLIKHLKKDEDFVKILEMVHKDFAKEQCEIAKQQKPEKSDNIAKQFYLKDKVKGDKECKINIQNKITKFQNEGINIFILSS